MALEALDQCTAEAAAEADTTVAVEVVPTKIHAAPMQVVVAVVLHTQIQHL